VRPAQHTSPLRPELRTPFLLIGPQFVIYGIAKCSRMWQSLLMAKSKLTAREKSRQERERAKSLEDRSRQLMRKAAQLQHKAQHDDIRQAPAGIAKQVIEGK
jgi:hypothetical protein